MDTDDPTANRAVELFFRRFGHDAARQASKRTKELVAHGDTSGAALWQRIEAALRVHSANNRNS